VIDPTKNVLDLVDAESRYRDKLRDADAKYTDDMRNADKQRRNDLSEQRDKLEERMERQRERYEERITRMQTDEVKANSDLLSKQLDRMLTTFGDRLAELERFRYEVGGRSSGISSVWVVVVGAIGALAAIVGVINIAINISTA